MYIGVAGNIGVGKSTLAELISSRLDFTLVKESVADNPYLEDFYKDPKGCAFELQIYLLNDKLSKLTNSSQDDIVSDKTQYEDLIFTKHARSQNNISKRDFETYLGLYDTVMSFIPTPDLIVYARVDVDTLKNNIIKRGRPFEQQLANPENNYINQLHELYENWANSYVEGSILTLDFNELDIKKNKRDKNSVIDLISQKLYLFNL